MFELLSYFTLQQYWWILVAVLWSALIFMMFVQWWQTLFFGLSKTEADKTLLINAFWKHYKLTFSVLVTFGWAVFASFPIFYAVSFGWAYLVWMAILFIFIIQAVAYEYRTKASNFLWQKTYEVFLFLNGLLWPLLLWVAVATFFTGSNFVIETSNLVNVNSTHHIISSWTTPFYWLEALWNSRELSFLTNISLGLLVVFLVRINANLYIINHISDKWILLRNDKCLKINTALFLVFFLIFILKLLTITWFNYDSVTGIINLEPYKYLHNLFSNWITFWMFIAWVSFFLLWIWLWMFKKSENWFWFAWFGTILVVMTLFILAWFNHTSFYPSLADLQSSLTIQNASASQYTLTAMSYVSLMVPFVLAYIIWAWRAISPKKMNKINLKKDLDIY